MTQSKASIEIICPCQSSNKSPILFSNCCEKYITGITTPRTAEQLMRSRYSAFVLEDEKYLLSSWHTSTKPNSIEFDTATKWLGLKIISTKMGQDADQEGWVNFIARYKVAGKAHRLEEHSHFTRELDQWRYATVANENNDSRHLNNAK
jgi:SEC-C motif-containing protein